MPRQEIDAFARRVGWIDDTAVIDPDTSVVEVLRLRWWDRVELITACDPAWSGEMSFAAWMRHDHLYRLTGESPPIHLMNKIQKPRIDADTVLSYLSFFCFFVRGEDGPFSIVQSAKDPHVPKGVLSRDVARNLRPAKILAEREDGFHCEAVVWYGNQLFLSTFVVMPSGMVKMIDDHPLPGAVRAKFEGELTFLSRVADVSDANEDTSGRAPTKKRVGRSAASVGGDTQVADVGMAARQRRRAPERERSSRKVPARKAGRKKPGRPSIPK